MNALDLLPKANTLGLSTSQAAALRRAIFKAILEAAESTLPKPRGHYPLTHEEVAACADARDKIVASIVKAGLRREVTP